MDKQIIIGDVRKYPWKSRMQKEGDGMVTKIKKKVDKICEYISNIVQCQDDEEIELDSREFDGIEISAHFFLN